ncbi:NAD(P)-binding protein [Peniophora sp. CONT]|nr:NAD(P)-binding protein [Peniophora sp. CONT]
MPQARVWLITGANSGIGLRLALHALAKGDKVIAAARDVAKLPSSLAQASPLALDPGSSSSDIKATVATAVSIHQRIDVLVNMAGYGLSSPVEYLDEKELKNQFDVNVFGPISIIQFLLPTMRAQKSGHILNVSSIAGFAGSPPFAAYNASKAALDAFTETLDREVEPFNIRALSIVPGYFPTNFLSTALATRKEDHVGEYTLPQQGYGVFDKVHQIHLDQEQIGDAAKAAARIWEIVAGEGYASGLVPEQGAKREWVRVPLGPDCAARMRTKIKVLQESVDAYEPIWSSTDVEKERLQDFA